MHIVNAKNQVARSFRLTIGLMEGYGGLVPRKPEEVVALVARWLKSQRDQGKPYLPGSVSTGTMTYFERDSKTVIAEPVAFYEGDVSPEYNAGLTDPEVLTALQEFAELVAEKLRQTRIYLRYNGIIQILERET